MKTIVIVKHAGHVVEATEATWAAVCDALVKEHGDWNPATSSIEREERDETPAPKFSEFGDGKQVIDNAAKTRIEEQHDALRAAGVRVNTDEQFFATGTRMAKEGYATQNARAIEHANKVPAREAIDALVNAIEKEQREDVDTTVGALADQLTMNGALKFDGCKLREQAIRGLLGRVQSPALRYVLGLRDRIVSDEETTEHKAMDKAALLDVMQRECKRFSAMPIKLRMRKGLGDIFAIVSPDYAPADAPSVLADVLRALPDDAKATFGYDPVSTTWEVRASVFTPTAVEQQAVGEAFEGYVSIGSRDNGTRRLVGGGGVLMLRCLNASTYEAASRNVSRVHRGEILNDIAALTTDAMAAIHALCVAWGTARADVIEQPKLVAIEDVIPGFYRHMLTARKGVLVGVLPGRTEKHVKELATTFASERRDEGRIVRADLAQGFTKYIQTQPSPVRRDAESAIATWIVNREPVAVAAE